MVKQDYLHPFLCVTVCMCNLTLCDKNSKRCLGIMNVLHINTILLLINNYTMHATYCVLLLGNVWFPGYLSCF